MPKKLIYSPLYQAEGQVPEFRVEVGWSRSPQGSVRVATKCKAAPGVGEHDEYLNESNSTPGVTWSGDPARADTGELKLAWDGWFVDLYRDQINELIRALREARDQAFGRDE